MLGFGGYPERLRDWFAKPRRGNSSVGSTPTSSATLSVAIGPLSGPQHVFKQIFLDSHYLHVWCSFYKERRLFGS